MIDANKSFPILGWGRGLRWLTTLSVILGKVEIYSQARNQNAPRLLPRGESNGGIAPRMSSVIWVGDTLGRSRGGRAAERFTSNAFCAAMGASPVEILWTPHIAMPA